MKHKQNQTTAPATARSKARKRAQAHQNWVSKNHRLSTQTQELEFNIAANMPQQRFDTQRNHGLSTQTQGLSFSNMHAC
jgi:hypothetical protein